MYLELRNFSRTSPVQSSGCVDRAATLYALAEDARARRLAGDTVISLEDVVRVDNAAQRAVRMLGIKSSGKTKCPTLDEYLKAKYGTPTP
jgi:hypothetical protein